MTPSPDDFSHSELLEQQKELWKNLNNSIFENCLDCGNQMVTIFSVIGGFPGHDHVHPSSVTGYRCDKCIRYFSLEEFMRLKEKVENKKAHAGNYWKNVRAALLSSYMPIIAIMFMMLSRSFWVGVLASVAIVLLLPLFIKGLEMIFSPLGKLIKRTPPSGKPPDNPKTP